MHDLILGLMNYHRRPDSSSSASSATDWEGNGHGTVLRRGQIPPVPLPQISQTRNQALDSHINSHPYSAESSDSNLSSQRKTQSSSDSDFPDAKCRSDVFHKSRSGIKTQISNDISSTPISRGLKIPRTVPVPVDFNSSVKSGVRQSGVSQQRLKLLNDKNNSRRPLNPINILDRLSVRTELNLNNEEGITASGKGLYYFPADEESELSPSNDLDNKLGDATKKSNENSNPTIQDQIIATQLRRLNRELTPTISDVYHERNIGLGLAPPLSKLLISNQPTNANFRNEKDGELVQNLDNIIPDETKRDQIETVAKSPWLSKSNLNLHANNESVVSGLISNDSKRHGSPCSELSKRDEGDGRSVADSQCSVSSFKKSLTARDEKNDSNDDSLYYEGNKTEGNDLKNGEMVGKPPMPRTRTSKGPPPPVPTSRNKIS